MRQNHTNMITLSEEQLAAVKQYELEIMDEIHRICVKHGIKYSLIYGSMMGAALYKGFIPWDDDIDIVFFRDQFELFRQACKEELSTKFFFQSMETDPQFLEPELFKIRRNDTVLLESADAHRKIHHGVWVDITLLENCDGNLNMVRKCKYYFGLWRSKYYYKASRRQLNIKGLIFQTFRRLLPPFTIKKTALKFSKCCHYCSDSVSKYVFHPFSYEDDVYPREWLEEIELVPFEGREYYCFKHYDEILRVRFPHYTPDYPKEKQVTNHRFVEVIL